MSVMLYLKALSLCDTRFLFPVHGTFAKLDRKGFSLGFEKLEAAKEIGSQHGHVRWFGWRKHSSILFCY